METDRYKWIDTCTKDLYYPWRMKGHRLSDGATTRQLALLGLSHLLEDTEHDSIDKAIDNTVEYMQFKYCEVIGKNDPPEDDANRAIACGLVFMGLVFSHSLKYGRHFRLCFAKALELGKFSDTELAHMGQAEKDYSAQMKDLLADIDNGKIESDSMITETNKTITDMDEEKESKRITQMYFGPGSNPHIGDNVQGDKYTGTVYKLNGGAKPDNTGGGLKNKFYDYVNTKEFDEGVKALAQYVHEGKATYTDAYHFFRLHGMQEMRPTPFGDLLHKHGGPTARTVSAAADFNKEPRSWKFKEIATFFPHLK